MSESDDFYYRVKPHAALVRRQQLSLEARGAAITYQDHMHTRADGMLPNEGTADGMRWHINVLGVRDRRTVGRVVVELLAAGELIRVTDGRLTSREVQKELAARQRTRAAGPSGGGQGSGGAPPAQRQFTLVPGGREAAPPVDEAGGEAVDTVGTLREMVRSRREEARLVADSRLKTQRNQRADDSSRVRDTHEVVAVFDGNPARARGDPASARA